MKIVIVHESMFGNTEAIANAIADGARSHGAQVIRATADDVSVRDLEDADLVVLGAPTHAHGMPAADARANLVRSDRKHRYPVILDDQGSLRSLIEELPVSIRLAAAFDTRFRKPMWLTGSAASWIERRLRAQGCPVASRQSYFVEHMGGPLIAGELARARAWGAVLVGIARSMQRRTGRDEPEIHAASH